VVGALWASVRPEPSLLVDNRLAAPVALALGDTDVTVPAGDTLRLPVGSHRPVEAHWAIVRPAALDGRMLGLPLEGSIVKDEVRGELREVLRAGADGIPRFAPLLVNATQRPLSAVVIAGRDTTPCGCSIAPGDSLRLGYYLLTPGSAVQVQDTARGRARFDPAQLGVDSATGSVRVRVTQSSLTPEPPPPRRSARRTGSAQRSPPRNPLQGFLPVH
jgi:hypothetical protein